ncbi:ubiquitin-conjugating enzyme E2-binding protein [Colletotrichum godetiae]|uniref:Ubiquitin-conjugating enzyme E2-binding protein n=1 Tax=Colletotrichum godetiae TaxID=1209918 RepID=A0AAJ0AP10_9PEZI|nr:ubiquitin-conjugating enzyme E2-binding protein [Colletotrichum godetiae]KAK1687738.1 ubiquitin-conjugating enzyme E2-binding protein [Colletotrichum godetiae]
MSSHNTPNIYAELLTNIRQLSVAVTLPSPAGGQTRALIAADGSTLHIHHAGTETYFPLPGRVLAQGDAPTALPTPPPSASSPSASHTLSWRLPLADSPAAPRTGTSLADDPVPWTARDLLPGSAVACRHCAAVVVPGGKAGEWKDLPSENWAEMMDFWHCHKPSTDHEHEHGGGGDGGKADHEHLTRRGYGANSSIAAQPGVGMVDLTSFLFCEADCVGLKFSLPSSDAATPAPSSSEVLARGEGISGPGSDPTPPSRMLNIACSACASHLGFFNVAISSVVLLKWQVSCQTITSHPAAAAAAAAAAQPTSSDCLAATLIATLSRSGSSKSVVVPAFQSTQNLASSSDGEVVPALHLWILNSNITYASSSSSSFSSASSPFSAQQRTKRAAIKLLYKEISQDEADTMLESMTSDVQEVNLPLPAIVAAAEGLKRSSEVLPPGERTFKGWNVGLLDKWEPGSAGTASP